jgi:hypothetical protein
MKIFAVLALRIRCLTQADCSLFLHSIFTTQFANLLSGIFTTCSVRFFSSPS